MFRDTLLESSPAGRKRKRWPMATAFAVEVAVAGLLIVLPLLSSGILPVSAHPPIWLPTDMPIARHDPAHSDTSSGGPRLHADQVVIALDNSHAVNCFIKCKPATPDADETGSANWDTAIGNNGPGRGFNPTYTEKPVLEKPLRVSDLSPAQLAHRVEPIYPRIAILTRQGGQVRLHAIIAKDGTIRSLEVMSGLPLLAGAAMDAVKQWRYYPYKLNGDPVEVETFITVNFRATGN